MSTVGNESILQLNDDCLLHILSFLSLYDFVVLGNVCSRFSGLVDLVCSKKYRVVDFTKIMDDKNSNLSEKRSVLKRIGKTMKELMFSRSNKQSDDFIPLFPKYCQNLEAIRFDSFNIYKAKILKKYLPLLQHLKELSLVSCGLNEVMLEKCFETTSSLKKIELSGNYSLTGECLIKVKNLEYLNIAKCGNIKPEYFSEVSKNNKTLKELNIENCHELNPKNFDDITEYLVNLEDLTISNSYPLCTSNDICKLSKLNKLKKIVIKLSYSDDDFTESNCCFNDVINALVAKDQLESVETNIMSEFTNATNSLTKFSKLRELKITWNDFVTDHDLYRIAIKGILTRLVVNSDKITNQAVLKCVELSSNLETLGLYRCKQVTSRFLFQLPDILRTRRPPKMLFIRVSSIFKDFLISERRFLTENRDLFKIIIEYSMPDM